MRLAPKRSARPVAAKASVPAMNLSCAAAISQPNAALSIARRAISPSAAPLGAEPERSAEPLRQHHRGATAARRRRAAAVSSVEWVKRLRQVVDQVVAGCSRPTETRKRPCGVRLSGPSIEARCSIRLSTPPRLVARVKSCDAGRDRHRRLLAAAHLEREHAAEIGHLPLRERMERVVGQARVVDRRHL